MELNTVLCCWILKELMLMTKREPIVSKYFPWLFYCQACSYTTRWEV
uniref:Uncharacterized protein n=1 Tax=Arundo donax TaxID=35708 RepID=A0A0A9EA47_ARUDO